MLPFVDKARMVTDDEKESVIDILQRTVPIAESHNVELHLETDLAPAAFKSFLDMLPHPAIKVNWDSGNSSGLGYVATQEFLLQDRYDLLFREPRSFHQFPFLRVPAVGKLPFHTVPFTGATSTTAVLRANTSAKP